MFDEDTSLWMLALFVLAAVLVGSLIFYVALSFWAEGAYDYILEHPKTHCDIDAFVQSPPSNKVKIALAHKLRIGSRQARDTPIALECTQSPHVKGLYVSRNVTADATDKPTPLADLLPRQTQEGIIDPTAFFAKKTVVVATIRMGFGHHRLAYSACSWALEQGYTTIFHDLLNIKSDESELINSVDALYSKFSRMASELGGPVEAL